MGREFYINHTAWDASCMHSRNGRLVTSPPRLVSRLRASSVASAPRQANPWTLCRTLHEIYWNVATRSFIIRLRRIGQSNVNKRSGKRERGPNTEAFGCPPRHARLVEVISNPPAALRRPRSPARCVTASRPRVGRSLRAGRSEIRPGSRYAPDEDVSRWEVPAGRLSTVQTTQCSHDRSEANGRNKRQPIMLWHDPSHPG
jgi:hypothetical protein